MSLTGAADDGDMSPDNSGQASAGGTVVATGEAGVATGEADSPAAPLLVDPAALRELGSQLEDPAVAQGFARDYTSMWDQRYKSLASSLAGGDEDAAMDAVLSLKTSSAMVGGVRLAELAQELENAIRVRDADRARLLLGEIAESGSDTVDELQLNCDLRDT